MLKDYFAPRGNILVLILACIILTLLICFEGLLSLQFTFKPETPKLEDSVEDNQIQDTLTVTLPETGREVEDAYNFNIDYDYPPLRNINDETLLQQEIYGSKLALESITGKSVDAIAYPGCTADGNVISMVILSDYLLGFSCGKNIDHRFSQRYFLSRIHVYNNFENFKKRLSGVWEVTYDYAEWSPGLRLRLRLASIPRLKPWAFLSRNTRWVLRRRVNLAL